MTDPVFRDQATVLVLRTDLTGGLPNPSTEPEVVLFLVQYERVSFIHPPLPPHWEATLNSSLRAHKITEQIFVAQLQGASKTYLH